MNKIEMLFFENYTDLEKLLKHKFSKNRGVSEYIERMEKVDYKFNHNNNWSKTYKTLKYIRHIRNQIAHGEKSNCKESDVDLVIDFYNQIIELKDPLSLYSKPQKDNYLKGLIAILLLIIVLLIIIL